MTFASELERVVESELADKELPSFAVVVVDSEKIIAEVAEGSGIPGREKPLTSETLYRTGSVGKTVTDLALLVAMEKGKIDLDRDVGDYLPSFHPENPFGIPVTLRHLMTHQAGLVREPPIGSYYDDSGPTLKKTVESLNSTTLLWAPGTRTKYSNAGLAVAGRVLEAVFEEPYAEVINELVYEPAGMRTAAVGLSERVESHLARGIMWDLEGRTWNAPLFDLGMSPAGDLYASTRDMAAFMIALLSDDGSVVSSETFELMWRPQSDPPKTEWHLDVGLGFSLNGKFLGSRKLARNGGAVYGYATELALLPEEGLGVYAVATRDVSNGTVRAVAHWALEAALAERNGEPLPPYVMTKTPFSSLPKKLSDCDASSSDEHYARFVGVYGWEHSPLTVCVKDGTLHALIEGFFLYPLVDTGEREVFTFPTYSLYKYEQIRFVGEGTTAAAAVIGHGKDGLRFPRMD